MSKEIRPSEELTVYYDLKTAPITFDFCHFIAAATAYAALAGSKGQYDLVILADGFRNITPREQSYSSMERKWRLWNLIVEIAKIVPFISNVSVLTRRPTTFAAFSYPPNYHPMGNNTVRYGVKDVHKLHKAGANVQLFRPSKYALKAADSLLRPYGDRVVTMTLRKAGFDSNRDSHLDEWHRFYCHLKDLGYQPVVIPDQDDTLGERTISRNYDWEVLEVASMSLDLRLAIYSRAKMNYVTNGGLVGIFGYSKVPFVWTSLVYEASQVASTQHYKEYHGLEPGQKYPWLQDNQHMVWEPDNFENLKKTLALWQYVAAEISETETN